MAPKTRILFVHHISSVGGASYCLLNVVRNLDLSVFEPVVLLSCEGPLVDELEQLGVKVLILPLLDQIPYNLPLLRRRSIKLYGRVFRSLRGFGELLRRESIDVVYLNNMMLAPYLKPAKKAGCKTVMHVREHWPLNEHRHQLEWVRSITYRYCDRLVAINKYSASIFPQKEAEIVYDWIDMSSRYKSMPMDGIFGEDCSGKRILLFTGGMTRIKGLEAVVNAFSDHVKGDEYRLLVLGTMPPDPRWKRSLKRMLFRVGIDKGERMRHALATDKRIKCIQPVYELTHLFEQSHCFVSYFTVPHANLTLAEGLILGTPSIAADNEEAREYSGDGRYAMLVPPNEPELFAGRLNSFLSDIDRWKKAALEGSAPLSAMFDKQANVNKLNRILGGLV